MQAIGKIGVIMPEIMDPLDYELLKGVRLQAEILGYDVIVFTGVFNSQLELQQGIYIDGLENIYELIGMAELNGILFGATYFNNEAVKARIYQILRQCNVPCLVLGDENPYFPCLYPQQRESMCMITEHLITEHHCRKLYCITGFPNHFESDERLAGFYDALDAAGIPREESRVFYGDFWKIIPRQIAEQIADGSIEKPDAIVCASDSMAIEVCDVLMESGISVPEEIAVTGYDGTWYASCHTPEITTIYGRERQYGIRAVCKLYEAVHGEMPMQIEAYQQHLRYGYSCGCGLGDHLHERFQDTSLIDHVKKRVRRNMDRKVMLATDFVGHMNTAQTLDELITHADQLGHVLPGWKWLDICLCEDWMADFEHPEQFRQSGFSDKMFLALSKRAPVNAEDQYLFPVQKLLPALQQPHEPLIIVLSSLHCEGQIFGYMSAAYTDVDDLSVEEQYTNWCDAFCNGLKSLQQKLYQNYIRQQIEELSDHDPTTGLYNKKGMLEQLPELIRQSRKKESAVRLLLISFVPDAQSAYLGRDVLPLIANALRMSADHDELYARVAEQAFAVICTKNEADWSESRILSLERRMRHLNGEVAGLQIPELVTDEIIVEDHSISKLAKLLDERTERMVSKVNLAAGQSFDYRIQLQRLRREIYLMPEKEWNILEIMRKIGISRSHFHRIYKELFSISCGDDVIRARIEKAKQLLAHTDLRIQEVALQCGYSNESHFMRQFKDKCGITATQFRKKRL
ncbi:MAG: substrate-binding domain-containing protein [Oscillospiraceae bacterium]|nr:substrate-binding domain-containing protein [Oscillospiraceae bacterium]